MEIIDSVKTYLFDNPVNINNFKLFMQKYNNGDCIALVGAGLSKHLQVPPWKELVRGLSTLANLNLDDYFFNNFSEQVEEDDRLLEIAGEAKNELERRNMIDRYWHFLKQELTPRNASYTSTHLTLMRSNFVSFLTTNFDEILERAASEVRTVDNSPQVFPYMDPTLLRHRRIFYLHGKISNRNIVFTKWEYENAYIHGNIQEIIASCYRNLCIVLIGKRMEMYLHKTLKEIKEKDQQRKLVEKKFNLENEIHPIHFIFEGLKEKLKNIDKIIEEENGKYQQYNFCPIFFKVFRENDYINLENIFRQLPQFRPELKGDPYD